MRKKIFILLITSLMILSNCQKKTNKIDSIGDEQILVRIGDITISKAEFIRRAEYTPRPNYCQYNFPVHKKIILNSLIAEKLMVLESNDTAKVHSSESMNKYLIGRKEQAMRQFLQYKTGHKKVKSIDTTAALNLARYTKRHYTVDFITATNLDTANDIANLLPNGSFSDIVNEFYPLDTIPSKLVKWHEVEDDSVMNEFYRKDWAKDDVIGPIKVSDNQYLIAKVKSFVENAGENSEDYSTRLNRIYDYKTDQKASAYYNQYVRDVMKDKKLNWDRDILIALVHIVAPNYLKSKEEQENRLQNIFWDIKEKEYDLVKEKQNLEDIIDKELFNIDGESWTVKRFFEYRQQHPLVFRQRKMKNNEFTENFQMAIVDMITDYYLTEEAYQQNINKVDVIQRNYNMWHDHIVGMYQFEQHLKTVETDTTIDTQQKYMKTYLNPYTRSLQQKYSDQIEINQKVFDSIELTRTQMIVYKTNAPFPVVVPPFPIVTDEHKMDYGKKMVQN